MAPVKSLHYGSEFTTTASWLVNEGSGLAVGATDVDYDGGSGSIAAGSVIRFSGHDAVYLVKASTETNLTLTRALEAPVADDSAISILTLTEVDDFLDEGFEPGSEEPQEVVYGDGRTGMDGVTTTGTFYALGDNVPTPGTDTWILYLHGTGATLYGGRNGCRIIRGKSGVRKHGEGPAYDMVTYSTTGDEAGSTIQNYD